MAGGTSSSSLTCTNFECNATFSTKSNLNRHIKSKHGPKVHAACGKQFPNQPWNIKRHMSTCGECKIKEGHHDIPTLPDKQNDDAGSLDHYNFLSDDGGSGQVDPTFGDLVNGDMISWDYEEYSFAFEQEDLKH